MTMPIVRIPSEEQVRDVYESLWAFLLKNSLRCSAAFDQEDEFLPPFANLADTLRPVRPLIDANQGWPHPIGRGLRVIVEVFDEVTREWGWEILTEPDERRGQLESRKAWFRDEVERPLYEAALSWQAGCRGLECPPDIDHWAEEGRKFGFHPTMTPEEGQARFRPALERWHKVPRFGLCYPLIDDERKSTLDMPSTC